MLVEVLAAAFVARDRPGLCTESVVLRTLEAGPVPVGELWRRARVSKRATRTLLNAAVRSGAVAIDDGRARVLARPPRAEPAHCPPLEELVSRLELEHPHFPVPYGTADPSFTGGPGVDWKPVRRETGPGVAGLPMTALLSQALVAFAVEYEQERRGPIQWAANVLRELPDRGDDVRSFAKRGTHGAPNLARLGVVTIAGTVVRPTAAGRAMRDAYLPLCEQVESRWRRGFGASLIDDVVRAVGAVARPFPLVVWTGTDFEIVTTVDR